ncbi:MAG: lamin tail domain-containing protein [SAR324 cluster bacterium]|nr:lamin tail domain-containing protein [SAR324 cluster bacterium]
MVRQTNNGGFWRNLTLFTLLLIPLVNCSDTEEAAISPSTAGDLVITEIMANPTVVPDPDGEWFELYNASGSLLNLAQCVISDSVMDFHIIVRDVFADPGEYITIAATINAGFPASYAFGPFGFILANTADQIILTCNAVQIDIVGYDNGTTFPATIPGFSLELSGAALDATSNNTGANWCLSTAVYNNPDMGTPNAANTCP